MRIGLFLLRRHALVYVIYGALMFGVLLVFLASFEAFKPWVIVADRPSAWSLVMDVSPSWFMFGMGIVAVTMHLPVAIANGVTRHEFVIGAGVFAVGTVVLLLLFKTVGLLLEALVYELTGLMDLATEPYPWPTLSGALIEMGKGLAFMLSGWLVGLLFYRLRVRWALVLSPVALLPTASGTGTGYTPVGRALGLHHGDARGLRGRRLSGRARVARQTPQGINPLILYEWLPICRNRVCRPHHSYKINAVERIRGGWFRSSGPMWTWPSRRRSRRPRGPDWPGWRS